jgi:acyl-CoA dehydrogenase
MSSWVVILIYIAGAVALAFYRCRLRTTVIAASAFLLLYLIAGVFHWFWFLLLFSTIAVTVFLNQETLRRRYVSSRILAWYRQHLPRLSDTEREAIAAGTVWWEGELFIGRPDWNKLFATGRSELTAREQQFIDGPVEELCRMVDSWRVNFALADIPPEVLEFIKRHKFLGLNIPERYGGLEFSATAQTEIYTKLFGVSSVVANFISVPNSLGPAELLLKYGTAEQKKYYLPRLARGDEIPCFALTGPLAGSDATAIPDIGVVCKGTWQNREVIGMRLRFDKRYITLAPVATLIGLAFKLKDPDHLIGTVDDYGITCALIPRDTPGLDIGRRHLPMGEPFLNGPIRGRDIFVPLDCIIGGRNMAGKGWRMLVDCLSAGRSISLPSISTCMAKRALAASSAYAVIRRQFNQPLARFEGIQKPLARIAGLTYITHAACRQTARAIDNGEKPAVASAILKYHCTELARQIALDTADIHGGKGVMKGPGNYLSWSYESVPVAITVEGANILTRNLIIFGLGAIRCHPYILREMTLAEAEIPVTNLAEFDGVLFKHIGFIFHNGARALIHALTGAHFVNAPSNPPVRRYYQHLERLSAAFALLADAAMLVLQSSLKRHENVSARLGDLLSMLYLCSMTLKQYTDDGAPAEELPVVDWACQYLLNRYEEAMQAVLRNFPVRPVAWLLRLLVFPVGGWFAIPADRLESRIVKLITSDTPVRRRLISGIYSTAAANNPLGVVDEVFHQALETEPLETKLRAAVKSGQLADGLPGMQLIDDAEHAGIITTAEAKRMKRYHEKMLEVIAVDEFPFSGFARDNPVALTTSGAAGDG